MLESVGREDDVKFVDLCEARGIPELRIGLTDNSGHLEIQDIANWNLADLGPAHKGTLAELFDLDILASKGSQVLAAVSEVATKVDTPTITSEEVMTTIISLCLFPELNRL